MSTEYLTTTSHVEAYARNIHIWCAEKFVTFLL